MASKGFFGKGSKGNSKSKGKRKYKKYSLNDRTDYHLGESAKDMNGFSAGFVDLSLNGSIDGKQTSNEKYMKGVAAARKAIDKTRDLKF